MPFIKIVNIALLTLFLLIGSASTVASDTGRKVAKPHSKPNIILILVDDMSWFDVGSYHQRFNNLPKNAITPNIDKIASEGMLFTRSFTSSAMCAPTRMQLYTGIYPVRNGAY